MKGPFDSSLFAVGGEPKADSDKKRKPVAKASKPQKRM